MEDIFQYIIVIGIIIAIVVSKIGKQEKKKTAERSKEPVLPPTEEDKKESQLPEAWEKWFNLNEEEDVKPTQSAPVVVTPKSQNIHEDPNVRKKSAVLTKDIKEKKTVQDSFEQKNSKPDLQLSSPEEARKAIIYSEILHRKY